MTACDGGFLGRIFGHKFLKRAGGDLVYRSDNCFRCGKAMTPAPVRQTNGEEKR